MPQNSLQQVTTTSNNNQILTYTLPSQPNSSGTMINELLHEHVNVHELDPVEMKPQMPIVDEKLVFFLNCFYG